MKKITTKNKIKLEGPWEHIEVFWHQKSDYILYREIDAKIRNLIPLGEFGRGGIPLEMTIDDQGTVHITQHNDFDIAVLKKKMELYGFKDYILHEDPNKINISRFYIEFTSVDELAMFQVYFSEFII